VHDGLWFASSELRFLAGQNGDALYPLMKAHMILDRKMMAPISKVSANTSLPHERLSS